MKRWLEFTLGGSALLVLACSSSQKEPSPVAEAPKEEAQLESAPTRDNQVATEEMKAAEDKLEKVAPQQEEEKKPAIEAVVQKKSEPGLGRELSDELGAELGEELGEQKEVKAKQVEEEKVVASSPGSLSVPAVNGSFDPSFFGHYKSYPPGQKPQGPPGIKLLKQGRGQLKGGSFTIEAVVVYGAETEYNFNLKYNPQKESLSGFALVNGSGVRLHIGIDEVRSGYDMTVRFTRYKGESAVVVGQSSYSYRKYR